MSSAQQQPTFRTGIQSVRVDLYATRDGQPVTDLRRDEISLLEDGVSQTIQTFERITFAAPTAIRPADPATVDETNIEGFADTFGDRIRYGGDDPDDSSGTLRYVRIEWAGEVVGIRHAPQRHALAELAHELGILVVEHAAG